MIKNSEFCVYGGMCDEVYGVGVNPDNNLSEDYFSGHYESYGQEDAVSYQTYYYEYDPVYYFQPVYLMYYSLIPVQYSTYNFYYPIYDYVPFYYDYYVQDYNCSVSGAEYNVGVYEDQGNSYQSPPVSSVEENSFTYEGFGHNLYDTENRSFNDMYNDFEQILSEGITTSRLSYEEYPEKLNCAPADDEDKGGIFDEKLDKDMVSNVSDVSEGIGVNQLDEQVCSVNVDLHEEEVDVKVIKKISLMSMEEVKEDIDENYEDGKAFIYNQVLKGYIEKKNQLEELQWECHTLEDILEEEEPESDSNEMDLIEYISRDRENINVKKTCFSDVEKVSSSLSGESLADSSEEALYDKCPSLNGESQTVSREVDKECRLLSQEWKTTSNGEALVEECGSLTEESQTAATNETVLFKERGSLCEESQTASNNETLVKECELLNGEPQTLSNKKALIEGCDSLCEESRTASSQEALTEENPTLAEDSKLSIESLVVEEKPEMESVPVLSFSKTEVDSGPFSSCENPDPNASSEELIEEKAAAPKTKQRKKRFTRLRNFFARICCCFTKPP